MPLGLFRRDEHPTSNITDTFSLSSGSGGSSSGDAWEAAAAALGRSAGARRKKKKVVSGGRAKPQAAKPQQSKKSQLQPIPGAAMSKAGKVLRTDITVSSQHPHGTAGVAAQHYAAGFAGAKYAAARELAAAAAAAAKRDAHEEAEMFAQAALEAVGDEDGVPPGQQLSAHLAAKLAHIYKYAHCSYTSTVVAMLHGIADTFREPTACLH